MTRTGASQKFARVASAAAHGEPSTLEDNVLTCSRVRVDTPLRMSVKMAKYTRSFCLICSLRMTTLVTIETHKVRPQVEGKREMGVLVEDGDTSSHSERPPTGAYCEKSPKKIKMTPPKGRLESLACRKRASIFKSSAELHILISSIIRYRHDPSFDFSDGTLEGGSKSGSDA